MDSRLTFVLALVIPLFPCLAIEVSKACFGSGGLHCMKHNLGCSSGRIAIQEAFYMDNTACGSTGISNCIVDVSSIPLNGTRYNFTDTELNSLNGNCSTQSTCSLLAGRRGALASFSAITYQCIDATTSTTAKSTRMTASQVTTVTATLTSTTLSRSSPAVTPDKTTTEQTEIPRTTTTSAVHDNKTRVHKDAESNTGTVVGIITPLCIIIAGGVTAVIIFRRRKLRHAGGNEKAVNAKPTPQEVFSLEKKKAPDNDYATTNDYLDLIPETHTMRSLHNESPDDDHYHQVGPPPTKTGSADGNKYKLQFKNTEIEGDLNDGNYHEIEPQTTNGSSEYHLAGRVAHTNLESQSAKKGPSGNITNQQLESQKAVAAVAGVKGTSDYDYAGENNYHEVEPQQGVQRSDYDYARCVDPHTSHEHSSSRKPQTHGSDYDHIGYQPTNSDSHYDTTLSVASSLKGSNAIDEVYSYNHLNDRNDSSNVADSTYNATSSTRHKLDASTNKMEDDYGYNHLGVESKKNLPQNEYDTSASALRDIARMNGDMEDSTYDHAHLVTPEGSSSGLATACFDDSDYDQAPRTNNEYDSNPYHLAK